MKKAIILLMTLISITSCKISGTTNLKMDTTKQEVKTLIEECYIKGALNEMNTSEMRRGYHKDFAIFFSEKNELKKLPLEIWIQIVEGYKKSNSDDGLRSFEAEFLSIEVTETAAFVKLNLTRKGELIFTDYITLLKFGDTWKIVTKIYHAHIDNPWNL
jgi:hypothetical protein